MAAEERLDGHEVSSSRGRLTGSKEKEYGTENRVFIQFENIRVLRSMITSLIDHIHRTKMILDLFPLFCGPVEAGN